jgi:hypothetical protein
VYTSWFGSCAHTAHPVTWPSVGPFRSHGLTDWLGLYDRVQTAQHLDVTAPVLMWASRRAYHTTCKPAAWSICTHAPWTSPVWDIARLGRSPAGQQQFILVAGFTIKIKKTVLRMEAKLACILYLQKKCKTYLKFQKSQKKSSQKITKSSKFYSLKCALFSVLM